MNFRSSKPDALTQLCRLWGLTPGNEALARAYLTNDWADESLLSGAEGQVFSLFDWQDREQICQLLKQVAGPNDAQQQARVLRLLWAIGRSSAVFAALFDGASFLAGDDMFHRHCAVLGTAAAAAMEAERTAAQPVGYSQVRQLHQLACTDPEVLLEAQTLIADPQTSMAGGVLAGVLLAAGPKAGMGDALLAQQVELVLGRVEAILADKEDLMLSDEDVPRLLAYLRAGDPAAPVPETTPSNAWHTDEPELLSRSLVTSPLSFAVECMTPAVLAGMERDARLVCALRVLTGLSLSWSLWGALRFWPEDGEPDALDALLPHIPGGAVTPLRAVITDFYEYHEEAAEKLILHLRAAAEDAVNYLNPEGYERLCSLLPELKNSKDKVWMEYLQGVMLSLIKKAFGQSPHQAAVCDYLTGREAFADGAALLQPVRNEYRYLYNVGEALQGYQKLAGWDDFACRCIILFCLTCTGADTSASLLENGDKKQNVDAFVRAILARGLPVRECLNVLIAMREYWYWEKDKALIEEAIRTYFIVPERLDGLADAALNSCASARVTAIEGLDKLSALAPYADRARRALIACAQDSSKQVQEVLVQCCIRHPDWEADYLALLGAKKAAQRSFAVRVLAGIDAGRYRPALEKALAAEKNTKLTDQLSALLKAPAPTDGAAQTPEELADRIVPTLGFGPDGTRVFDYGPRKCIVRLTPTLELAVATEAGKAVKSLPSPGKADDPQQAPAAYEAYKAMKKQIKTTVSAQRARLEMALSVQRCWDSGAWRKLFVENPVMHQFAISLIWGVYEAGGLKETFRYMEDGSFNTVDEEEYILPDGASVGLVHPIELDADALAAWKQQLEDYEITQSIVQLSRPVYRLAPQQAQATALETAAGRVLNSLTLTGKLQSLGWYRGSVLDGGGFYSFYREDPAVGLGVELNFSGSFVGGDYGDVTVFDAVFYRAGAVERGGYCYATVQPEHILPLGQVPARYYSEVVWQLERATSSSIKTDPNWRQEKG